MRGILNDLIMNYFFCHVSINKITYSRNDFIAKIYIALKEANETLYWLQLLYSVRLLVKDQYDSIYADCLELKKLLTTITKTTRENEGKE